MLNCCSLWLLIKLTSTTLKHPHFHTTCILGLLVYASSSSFVSKECHASHKTFNTKAMQLYTWIELGFSVLTFSMLTCTPLVVLPFWLVCSWFVLWIEQAQNLRRHVLKYWLNNHIANFYILMNHKSILLFGKVGKVDVIPIKYCNEYFNHGHMANFLVSMNTNCSCSSSKWARLEMLSQSKYWYQDLHHGQLFGHEISMSWPYPWSHPWIDAKLWWLVWWTMAT